MSMIRTRGRVLAVLLVLVASGIALHRTRGWAQYRGPVDDVQIDLAQPDAMILTRSLTSLPSDLLKVPLAHDLLREELVFYYQEHPDRLGLKGSLRRIAYEHRLSWGDEVLAWTLDRPAELLVWRGPRGALDHWMLSLTRPELAKVVQEAATIAMKDRQLSLAGQIVIDDARVPVYAFSERLFAAYGDRVVVFSTPGMLLNADGSIDPAAETMVRRILSGDERQRSVCRDTFLLDGTAADHSVVVRMHYLSFGYQKLFPGFVAVRFDFGAGAWTTHVLLDGRYLRPASFQERELWAGVPADPAACALLPVDWPQGRAVAERLPDPGREKAGALANEMAGPAAICWYARGRVHTPLVVATLRHPRGNPAPLLEGLFNWGIRLPDEAAPSRRADRTAIDQAVWQRELMVPYMSTDDADRPAAGPLKVTLARKGRYIFFSPDGEQVERALATVDKRFPSLAEALPADAATLGVLFPKALAEIGRKEALVMLPRADEPVFRAAAERQLLPRLDAMAGYPPYRLSLVNRVITGRHWERVEWQRLTP